MATIIRQEPQFNRFTLEGFLKTNKFLPWILFFLTVAIFFSDKESIDSKTEYAILKCLPILSLIYFAYVGENLAYNYRRKKYFTLLKYGLIASVCGDFFLAMDDFRSGVIAFGIAQICYQMYFRYPLESYKFLLIMSINLIFFLYKKNLEIDILMLVINYALSLKGMLWNSVEQYSNHRYVRTSHWSWWGAFGGIMFCISDALIGWTTFIESNDSLEMFIMPTYYMAQFGISLNALKYL